MLNTTLYIPSWEFWNIWVKKCTITSNLFLLCTEKRLHIWFCKLVQCQNLWITLPKSHVQCTIPFFCEFQFLLQSKSKPPVSLVLLVVRPFTPSPVPYHCDPNVVSCSENYFSSSAGHLNISINQVEAGK